MMKKLILGVVALMALTFVACEDDTTTYMISFDTNGGTEILAQTIEEGDTVVTPEDPTKDGYDFTYWTLDGEEYNFSVAVNTKLDLLATWSKQATTTDFEDVTLNASGLAQNDSISGSIESGALAITCSWSSSNWGTFGSGFTVSNHKDIITSGYTNPYSCIAASGAKASSNFATFNSSNDSVKFDSPVDMESVMLCNNTYAYLSMLNGDSFSKKFEDGDYFKLTLTLYGEDNSSLGTQDFYLADFRDGKSLIVNEWTELDLSTFTGVSYIKFSFDSTDMGDWGINTPKYFCLDNINYYSAE